MDTDDKKPVQDDGSDAPSRHPEDDSGRMNSKVTAEAPQSAQNAREEQASVQQETGGYEHTKDPTRYGDWEIAGRCVDF